MNKPKIIVIYGVDNKQIDMYPAKEMDEWLEYKNLSKHYEDCVLNAFANVEEAEKQNDIEWRQKIKNVLEKMSDKAPLIAFGAKMFLEKELLKEK